MENLGSLIIVLHSHLPYGLGHDPMEEHWIYEAAVETYLPLLDMAERLGRDGIKPRFAVSFTPVLIDHHQGRPDSCRGPLPGRGGGGGRQYHHFPATG